MFPCRSKWVRQATAWLTIGVSLIALASSGAAENGVPDSLPRLAQAKPTAPAAQQPAPPAGQNKTGAPAAAAAPAQPWAVNCSNLQGGKFACEMKQGLVDQKSRTVVLLISVRNTSDKDGTAFLFRTFHGVYLPAGMTIQVDGAKPTKLDFQKSDRFGVYAGLPINAGLLGELKKGRELVAEIEVKKGQKVQLKALLDGFGPGHDRVVAAK